MQRGQFAGTFYDVRCSNTGTPRGGAGAGSKRLTGRALNKQRRLTAVREGPLGLLARATLAK